MAMMIYLHSDSGERTPILPKGGAMRRKEVICGVVAIIIRLNALSAQTTDFSGRWTIIDNAPSAQGGPQLGRFGAAVGGFSCGEACTILQSAGTLTVIRAMPSGEQKLIFKLDNSESRNALTGRGGAVMEVVSKAQWDKNRLVIKTTREFQGQPVTSTQTLWLQGSSLIVESVGRDGATPTKMIYKKASQQDWLSRLHVPRGTTITESRQQ